MINYIFAAEFDLHKGTKIKSLYPQDSKIEFNEAILASYMLPDGSHNVEFNYNQLIFTLSFQRMLMYLNLS